MTEQTDQNCQNLFFFKQDTNQSYFSILPNQTNNQSHPSTFSNHQSQHTSFLNSQSQHSFSCHQPIRNQQHHISKSDDDKSVQSSDYIDPSPLGPNNNGHVNLNGPKSSDIVYTDLNNLQYIIQKQQQLLLSSLKDNTAISDDQKVAETGSDKNGANSDKNGGKIGDGEEGVAEEGSAEFEWKLKVRSDGTRYL